MVAVEDHLSTLFDSDFEGSTPAMVVLTDNTAANKLRCIQQGFFSSAISTLLVVESDQNRSSDRSRRLVLETPVDEEEQISCEQDSVEEDTKQRFGDCG